MIIKDIEVTVSGGEMSVAEIEQYIDRGFKKHGQIESLHIEIEGNEVDLRYHVKPVRFDRIRRITGYLVGTLDRFNDGKRAEVNDRVKHM